MPDHIAIESAPNSKQLLNYVPVIEVVFHEIDPYLIGNNVDICDIEGSSPIVAKFLKINEFQLSFHFKTNLSLDLLNNNLPILKI